MTGAREPWVCRDRGFDYAESLHLDQCRNEAMRAIEKLYVRNAFTFEDAIGATGVTDVSPESFFRTDEKNPFWFYVRHVCRRSFDSDYAARFILEMSVSAIAAGVSATAIPAAWSASIFPAAVPLPPEMIAPA
jgi:hypothetical protein